MSLAGFLTRICLRPGDQLGGPHAGYTDLNALIDMEYWGLIALPECTEDRGDFGSNMTFETLSDSDLLTLFCIRCFILLAVRWSQRRLASIMRRSVALAWHLHERNEGRGNRMGVQRPGQWRRS